MSHDLPLELSQTARWSWKAAAELFVQLVTCHWMEAIVRECATELTPRGVRWNDNQCFGGLSSVQCGNHGTKRLEVRDAYEPRPTGCDHGS
jgi:hypothetical protein